MGIIADIKENNVLNIKPTLRNSKYAFLFFFQYRIQLYISISLKPDSV